MNDGFKPLNDWKTLIWRWRQREVIVKPDGRTTTMQFVDAKGLVVKTVEVRWNGNDFEEKITFLRSN